VSAANPDAPVFKVTASWVSITGFTVQNASGVAESGKEAAGVYLGAVEQCTISGNDVTGNNMGIWLEDSCRNTLTDNNVHDNVYGIFVDSFSDNNVLVNNTASNNSGIGLVVASSSGNTFSGNTAENNAMAGIYLEDSSGNTLTDNNACNHNDVGDVGIALFSSSCNALTSNNAVNNTIGIALVLSPENTLADNIISGNSWRGIYLEDSGDNAIYNNYFDNVYNVQEQHEGTNTWNITKTAGTNIIGGPYLGGNYWSDYAGADTNGDGLGDTLVPYAEGIPHCGDYLPLVTPAGPVGAVNEGAMVKGTTYEAEASSAGATVAGTTYEANTNLLAGASIVLELDGEEVAGTTSDANGGYSFTVGGVGNYTVTVTKGGFTSQSKWADVTALEQSYTVDFKGVDAPYPTAPSGSYVLKCSNLWLCGAYYPQGFALDSSRVVNVLYAWVHPS